MPTSAVPRALPLAVEEMLRWTTPVVGFMRTTTRAVELGGPSARGRRARAHALRLGQPGRVRVRSDGRRSSTPARDPNPHVAFGFGAHFCIGAVLARVEGRILLEELMARFGSMEIGRPGGPHRVAGHRRRQVGTGGLRRPVTARASLEVVRVRCSADSVDGDRKLWSDVEPSDLLVHQVGDQHVVARFAGGHDGHPVERHGTRSYVRRQEGSHPVGVQ